MIAENVPNMPHDDGLEGVRMLNVTDLSSCLRISVRQCWRMSKQGLLPAPLKIGRCVRWRLSEISEWLQAGSPTRDQWEAMRPEKQVTAPGVEDRE